MTPEQIEKLPKWAQHEINVMQIQLREAITELARMRTNEKSNTFTGHPVTKDVQFLRENAQVTFCLPTGEVTMYVKKDVIDVNAHSGETFAITPRASNACELKFNSK